MLLLLPPRPPPLAWPRCSWPAQAAALWAAPLAEGQPQRPAPIKWPERRVMANISSCDCHISSYTRLVAKSDCIGVGVGVCVCVCVGADGCSSVSRLSRQARPARRQTRARFPFRSPKLAPPPPKCRANAWPSGEGWESGSRGEGSVNSLRATAAARRRQRRRRRRSRVFWAGFAAAGCCHLANQATGAPALVLAARLKANKRVDELAPDQSMARQSLLDGGRPSGRAESSRAEPSRALACPRLPCPALSGPGGLDSPKADSVVAPRPPSAG